MTKLKRRNFRQRVRSTRQLVKGFEQLERRMLLACDLGLSGQFTPGGQHTGGAITVTLGEIEQATSVGGTCVINQASSNAAATYQFRGTISPAFPPGHVLTTQLVEGSSLVGNGTVNASDGTFVINVPASNLTDGVHTLSVSVSVDRSGAVFTVPNLVPFSLRVDGTAPTVSSFARKDNAARQTNADVLAFDILFSEPVSNVTANDFVIKGTSATGVLGGSGSAYTLTVSGGDLASLNGSVSLDLGVGQDIVDSAGNPLPENEPTIDQDYVIDNLAPTTFTLEPIDDATGVSISTELKLTFGENVTLGTGTIVISPVNGGSQFVQTIVLPNSNVTAAGSVITIKPPTMLELNTEYFIQIDGTAITDLAGNEFPGITTTTIWNITTENNDTSAPRVSIVRQVPTTSPTNADQVTFRVVFDEEVRNVDITDFTLSGTAAAGTITTVAALSPAQYDVTINGLDNSNGTVNLDFTNNQDIQDLVGNALVAAPTAEQEFVIDNIPPAVLINAPASVSGTALFNVTFQFIGGTTDEDVVGFTINDIIVNAGTASGFTAVDGNTYRLNVTPDGSGSNITIDVPAGVAQDAANNPNTAAPRAIVTVIPIVVAPTFNDLDALTSGNQHLRLATADRAFANSNLPVAITENRRPRIEFRITEQQLSTKELIEKVATNTGGIADVIVASTVTIDTAGVSTIQPLANLAPGQHTFFVRAADAAGTPTNSATLTFFISDVGVPTFGAPSTPVFTTLYDVKAAINAAVGGNPSDAVQPWQVSFDKTTQTFWFSTEKAGTLARFDPSTGKIDVYNLRVLLDDPSNGDNPHGIFFDFNTHLTPRVWVAHRNAGGAQANVGGGLESDGRLSYLDIAKNELVTFDFADPTIKQMLTDQGINGGELPAFHAVFTDPTGDVWVSSPDTPAILQFDFNETNATCGIDCSRAKLVVHSLPEDLTTGFAQEFHPHAFQVVVDDRVPKNEGSQWVWAIDIAGSGRVALMRPGLGTNGQDLWTTWDVGDRFKDSSGSFVQFDDNETPGIPEDDFILATFSVASGGNGKPQSNPTLTDGIVHRFSLVNPSDPLNSAARIQSWIIPKFPGSDASTTQSATIQPYVDRTGNVFVADRYGSLARFDPNDATLRSSDIFSEQIAAAISVSPATPIDVGVIDPTRTRTVDNTVLSHSMLTPLDLTSGTVADGAFSVDRANVSGLDQYEISGSDPAVPSRGRGLFRGAINAGNTFYGSLAQSNLLSVTVFAESSRRNMAAVVSPLPSPSGAIVQARMAFQVVRNGSLILTARGDGKISDEQINLLAEMVSTGRMSESNAADFTISGDAAAVTNPDGSVHVMGRSRSGGVIQYTFTPSGNDWEQKNLVDTANWSVSKREIPGHILAEDPSPADALGFSATTTDGHWLAIPIDPTRPVRDLTAESGNVSGGRVYSGVGTTTSGQTLFGYGSNQTGNLVEYRIESSGQVTVRLISARGRETRVLQNIEALTTSDGVRHIFASDGVSRLVHWEIDSTGVRQENVSQITTAAGMSFGYFPYQKDFAGRVYTYVEPLVESDGTIRVYGTDGGNLIEFTRSTDGQWRVGNLTQDTNATYGSAGPGFRVPANAVFGAPTAYIDSRGGRHVMQINAQGEVIEYFTYGNLFGSDETNANRFNTQNINFFTNKSAQALAADLSIPTNIPIVTASFTEFIGVQASAAPAPTSIPIVTASTIETVGVQASAARAPTSIPIVTASTTETVGVQASAAPAPTSIPIITASITETVGVQALAASALTSIPIITASTTETVGVQALAAPALTSIPVVTASTSETVGVQALAAPAPTNIPVITASASETVGVQALAAPAPTNIPVITASANELVSVDEEMSTEHTPSALALAMPEDVDGDGIVTAKDALLVINRLIRDMESTGNASANSTSSELYNLDVNRDNHVSAFDVLLVINYLVRMEQQPEGEFIPLTGNTTDDDVKRASWEDAVDQAIFNFPV